MSLLKPLVLLAALFFFGVHSAAVSGASEEKGLTLVVMDPLSEPLACDCVKGYAQRKYEELGKFLMRELGQKVDVVWGESLEAAMEQSGGKADIIIGKHSVVLADARDAKIHLAPLARLTDLNDKVEQTGLIVVRSSDPAQSVKDLKGYRILFGPADCDEKSASPMELFRSSGIELPKIIETSPSCSNAAVDLMAMPETEKACIVISSYAGPLLEGCGKVKKGDLRVIGESKPVPFITLFVREEMPKADRAKLSESLENAGLDAKLLVDLETASGFIPWEEPKNGGEEGSSVSSAKPASLDAKKKP
ncbi:MAG: PhnD/SsuA/transferrin family substrate-binding protein [Planctomycetota bacterium]